jgi:ubiquinone/menaquinone biosynthesis C-methylase UbiE
MTPDADYLATGFRDVDTSDAAKMASCLNYLDSLPSFQAYKSAILSALGLKPGVTVADLGCGLGFDVTRIAERVCPNGNSLGVDSSFTLLRSGRDRINNPAGCKWIQSDIHHLPFQDSSLDACKIDRTLQHLSDPARVLEEAFRVLRPGGVLVCAEPDWATFTTDDDDRLVAQQIAQSWARSFRNPWIGRQLRNYLRAAGFINTSAAEALLVAQSFESSDQVFDLVQTARRLADSTGSDAALRWIAKTRERDNEVPIRASVTLFLTTGRKPTY